MPARIWHRGLSALSSGTVLSALPVPPLTRPSLPRSAAGYSRRATDDFIEELTDFYETVWLERKRLSEKVDALEAAAAEREALKREVARLQGALEAQSERQEMMSGALYSAEWAESVKEDARRDGETALKKSREEAEEILAAARRERDALEHEAERLHALATQTRSDLVKTLMSVRTLMSVAEHLKADLQWDGDEGMALTHEAEADSTAPPSGDPSADLQVRP
jgi:cell division septum initiation protein DivIVA